MKKQLLVITISLICIYMTGQEINMKKCGTTQLVKLEKKENTSYREIRENYYAEFEKWKEDYIDSKNPIITIPVVVHIIHKSSHTIQGQGSNIHEDQVNNAIDNLNKDFRKLNSEFPNPPRSTFLSTAADCELEFCLATIDPQGNVTNGITRTPKSTNNGRFDCDGVNTDKNDMKKTIEGGKDNWDPLQYLNIWVCDLENSQGGGQTLGFSYLPGLQSIFFQSWKDGVVVDFQAFGDTLQAGNSDGRTPTHEVGHYLGLNHTFAEDDGSSSGGPCIDSQGNLTCCDNDNSNVNDTPPTDDIYWGSVNGNSPSISSQNYNTCNDQAYGFNTDSPDMHENYMSYARDTWMFTHDQANVFHYTLSQQTNQGGRIALTTSDNCSATSNIDERIQDNIIDVFPNPSNGLINIKLNTNEKVRKIIIHNIIGEKLFYVENIESQKITINFSSFVNGIYYATIYTNNTKSIEKIVISQ